MNTPRNSSDAQYESERGGTTLRLVGSALAVFVVGVAVYVFDRAPGSTAGLPGAMHLGSPATQTGPHAVFGALGGSLPTFAHVFAFSLLSVALLPRGRRLAIGSCAFWTVVNSVFEGLQNPAWSLPAAEWLRSSAVALPGAEALARYLVNGRFDAFDVAAAVLGGVAAFVFTLASRPAPTTSTRKPS